MNLNLHPYFHKVNSNESKEKLNTNYGPEEKPENLILRSARKQ